jgi:hypothetical protein
VVNPQSPALADTTEPWSAGRRLAHWLVPAALVFTGSMLLDTRTLMPGLGFWDTGMSVLVTSPAYLLILPALRWGLARSRVVTGAALAVLLITVVNLMHFSQGWVQFGYRFSNDFVPWALLLVAIGLERVVAWGTRRTGWQLTARLAILGAGLLVVLSVAVNFWGVVWGDALGW